MVADTEYWLFPFWFTRLNIGKNDLLTFYDGDDLTAKVLGQYGGSKSRFKLYTSTADVTIQFQSDPATNIYGYGNGFVVHFFGKWRNHFLIKLNPIMTVWTQNSVSGDLCQLVFSQCGCLDIDTKPSNCFHAWNACVFSYKNILCIQKKLRGLIFHLYPCVYVNLSRFPTLTPISICKSSIIMN